VIVGDFNLKLAGVLKHFGTGNARKKLKVAGIDYAGTRVDPRTGKLSRIDYALFNPRVRKIQVRILRDLCGVSDHYPLLIDLPMLPVKFKKRKTLWKDLPVRQSTDFCRKVASSQQWRTLDFGKGVDVKAVFQKILDDNAVLMPTQNVARRFGLSRKKRAALKKVKNLRRRYATILGAKEKSELVRSIENLHPDLWDTLRGIAWSLKGMKLKSERGCILT
jgi:hypothetical protein